MLAVACVVRDSQPAFAPADLQEVTAASADPVDAAPDAGADATLWVVAHTHWDREWYHPAARFRQRLVALVDALLAAPPEVRRPFFLDGQAIILDDYLAVRPEARDALASRLADGTLEAGPWYVLGDLLIPGGEAIVRNLEAGRRTLARLGVRPPPVAWNPDAFGHPDAMPTIATGFGLPVAVGWRGIGGDGSRPSDLYCWRSAAGDEVLLHQLPPDGYEFGSALPAEPDAGAARWRRIRAVLRPRSTTGHMLLTVGADHHAAPADLDTALTHLTEAAGRDGVSLRRAGAAAWAAALLAHVASDAVRDPIPILQGEQRDSYGIAWTLQGTLGTRADLKRRNARLERALVHDVEPWLALAWLHAAPQLHDVAADGRITLAQAPALLAHAWTTLLRTHPHDTLCGCASDAVALDMAARQRAVAAQVTGLRTALLEAALGHDPVAARARRPGSHPPVVVRNRSGYPRHGIAELRLLETVLDVPVGPGSAAVALVAAPPEPVPAVLAGPPVQPLRERLAHHRRESPQHYPDDDLVRARDVVAWLPPVPAHGVRVVGVSDTDGEAVAPPHPVTLVRDGTAIRLDNGRVQVTASPDGLSVARGDVTVPDAVRIESTTDAGDSYTPSLRGAPSWLRPVRVRAIDHGPLRATVQLRWRLDPDEAEAIPSDVASTASIAGGGRRPRRRIRRGAVTVDVNVVLDAGADHLRFDVRVVNRRRDHRLRVHLGTGVRASRVLADAAFGPVWRDAVRDVVPSHPMEQRLATMPLHRWLAAFDGARGATVVSDGLAEVEPLDGGIAVTLLRAIGELSRRDLPERPGHAGWPLAIPGAQGLGVHRARLGLLLHGGPDADTLDAIERTADAVLLPLVGSTWRDLESPVGTLAGVVLEGRGLRASSVTAAITRPGLRLRAVNLTEAPVAARWILPDDGPWESVRCRLDETPTGAVALHGRALAFTAAARETVTHCVRRAAR
jgi:hypothetical protein